MLWGGRNNANKYHWRVWGVLAVSRPHWVCPRSQRVCFPSLHCSGSRLLFQGLSEAGPVLSALPRSKPPRFRSSSTPQRHRFDWACVLCPSPVRAAQVTRCFASCNLSPPPSHCSVFWVYNGCTFSGVPCVSSGELVSGWDPPGKDSCRNKHPIMPFEMNFQGCLIIKPALS